MSIRRLSIALCAAFLVSSAFVPAASDAATPEERTTSARAGAAWLAERITPAGYIPDVNDDPDYANTAQSALALAAAASEQASFDAVVGFLAANVDEYVAPGGADDSVGALGYLLLLTDAAGVSPTDFGGIDLIARLQATLGAFEPGLYGASDPTFDGVYRQGLAVLGLAAHDVAPDPDAVAWLVGQQCASGGWEAYRADTDVPCGPPDPINFIGPDSNSTALAVQALAAIAVAPPQDALGFLDSTQGGDGGWAFLDGLDVDPNSTALVVQALVSRGEDPESGRWLEPGGSPYDSLIAWQIVSGDPPDVGGFASPFSDGFADQIATEQAVWGVAGRAFPFGPVDFDGPDPTDPTVDTTSEPTSPDGGGATRPRFTG